MASTAKYVAGAQSAYASAGFTGTDFNSLANGSVVVASTAISNGTNLDMYADVSFIATVGGTTASTSTLSLYVLPLNRDASTYGDGIANGSALPSVGYLVGTIGVKSGVTSGNTITGTFRQVTLPPTNFKFAIGNGLGVALNATASVTCEYKTYNVNLNG